MKKLGICVLMLVILLSLSTCARVKILPDYGALLIEAVTAGDTESGRALCAERNARIAQGELEGQAVDYDELALLARLIFAQAGERHYSDDYRFCVGEMVMNRVASPEFPDTLEEVVFQRRQFLCTQEPEFADLRPSRACAQIALRLLEGERHLAPQVLYQSPWQIGPAYVRFYDRLRGDTYFCESVYAELYDTQIESGPG